MHEHKVARMYLREFFGALAIYSVMVVLTIMYGRGMPEGFVRTLVLASPMIGFLLMTWAAARQIKRVVSESAQALSRADHSGKAISQFLTGSKEAELFQKARSAINWADRLGLGTMFDLFRGQALTPQDETRYGEILDKVRALLDEQNLMIKKL